MKINKQDILVNILNVLLSISFIIFIIVIGYRFCTYNGYDLRGKIYVETCPQCKAYQGLECYEDLNEGQESIEKNCVKCDYNIREEN